MPFQFSCSKRKDTPTRRAKFLPRWGVYVDFADYEWTCRYVPLFEAVLAILDGPITPQRLASVLKQQFAEVRFRDIPRPHTVEAMYRVLHSDSKILP